MIRPMATTIESPTTRAKGAIDGRPPRRVARWLAGGGRWLALCLVVLAVLARPAPARADEDPEKNDARLEGFNQVDAEATVKGGPTKYKEMSVAMPKSGTGGTWIIFILVTVVGVAVLFKNAKRTHLD